MCPIPTGYGNGPAQKDLEAQAAKVVLNLKVGSVTASTNREIIAVIAYLQRLGTDIRRRRSRQSRPQPNELLNERNARNRLDELYYMQVQIRSPKLQ